MGQPLRRGRGARARGPGPPEQRHASASRACRPGRASRRSSSACGTWRRATWCRSPGPARACRCCPSPSRPRRSAASSRTACSAPRTSSASRRRTRASSSCRPSSSRAATSRRTFGLDDAVLDIEVTPNRPDFLSVLGIAREVAAATGTPIVPPGRPRSRRPRSPPRASATLEVLDAERCPRYLARILRDVGHGPSPIAAQARLTAAGMRPISAVVDATNYAMLEVGQPLHPFDLSLLKGPGIVVRRAEEGERMVTLDDVERTFTSDDLLICDVERPVGVAGVMGGAARRDLGLDDRHPARGGLVPARGHPAHAPAPGPVDGGLDAVRARRGPRGGAGRGRSRLPPDGGMVRRERARAACSRSAGAPPRRPVAVRSVPRLGAHRLPRVRRRTS